MAREEITSPVRSVGTLSQHSRREWKRREMYFYGKTWENIDNTYGKMCREFFDHTWDVNLHIQRWCVSFKDAHVNICGTMCFSDFYNHIGCKMNFHRYIALIAQSFIYPPENAPATVARQANARVRNDRGWAALSGLHPDNESWSSFGRFYMRVCWNRQTGKFEVLVFVWTCGFESHYPHHQHRYNQPSRPWKPDALEPLRR